MAIRKKRFKKNIIKFFLSIILVSLVSYISFAGYSHFFGNNNSSNDGNVIKNNNNNKKPEAKDEVYKLKLLATGDGLIHSVIYRSYYKNGVYDFTDAVKYVKDIVKDYDIAYYNQETPTGDDSIAYSGYPMFYTPSAYVDAMQDVGFNTVSLASNHSLDKGEKGVLNTIKYFKTTNMLYNGMNDSEKMRNNFTIKEKNNITYTMLSYTTKTNGLSTPKGKEYLINIYDKEQVKKDIEAVRDKVDVLIVAMHWGVEYTHNPTEYEKDMASYLASLNVDVIIGTHPHVIQPVTWIEDTLVIYSLGNFISAQYQNQGTCSNYKCTVGLMTDFKIEKTVKGNKKEIKITNVENELIYNYYNQSTWRGFLVIPFSNPEIAKYLPNYKKVYETYKEVVQRLDNTMYVKETI